jgi:SulP family sulfate permease
VLVYRISGAFFSWRSLGDRRRARQHRRQAQACVVDFAAVPFLDSTAANAMDRVAAQASRQGIRLFITGASPTVRRSLRKAASGAAHSAHRAT